MSSALEPARIAALLAPFAPALAPAQLEQISIYIDMLKRWNERINLTAVRDPEDIVTRHFGESLFAARQLLAPDSAGSVLDVGSGAGFPGLPVKIFAPGTALTLVEAQNKKATFLREVIRALALEKAQVFSGRAEDYGASAGLVTMRAVEKFDNAVAAAARLVSDGGCLALLIGAAQVPAARELLPHLDWQEPTAIPQSRTRVLLAGNLRRQESHS